jgi:hypothetical protein
MKKRYRLERGKKCQFMEHLKIQRLLGPDKCPG